MELATRMKERVQHLPRLMTAVQAARGLRWRAPLWAPPGHYYSPIPSLTDLEARRPAIWGRTPRELAGIDPDEDGQLALLDALAPSLADFADVFAPSNPGARRYSWPNASFAKADAAILYALIRHLRPTR